MKSLVFQPFVLENFETTRLWKEKLVAKNFLKEIDIVFMYILFQWLNEKYQFIELKKI